MKIARMGALALTMVLLLAACAKGPAPNPAQDRLAASGNDGTMALQIELRRNTDGQWQVTGTAKNIAGADVDLVHECDNTVRITGLTRPEVCPEWYSVLLKPGESWTEDHAYKPARLQLPEKAAAVTIVYQIHTEGKPGQPKTLTVPLQAQR